MVSIHAPRAGCDVYPIPPIRTHITRFNSRTPCGVRLVVGLESALLEKFQFTHPVRGATAEQLSAKIEGSEFQFTHPVRGATAMLKGTHK